MPGTLDNTIRQAAGSALAQGEARGLDELRPEDRGRVLGLDVSARDAGYLRSMGLRPGATLRVTRQGDPCVVEVLCPEGCRCGPATRIGLARDLSRRVRVLPLASGR